MSRVGLQIPRDLSFEDWQRAGQRLSDLVDSSMWCLGDWLVYGKACYADRYRRAIRVAGLQYQTLRNYAWVSRRFEIHRRRARLTFQHHAEVAGLPEEQQDRWLDKAEQTNWTTKQLRTQIRNECAGTADKKNLSALVPRIEVPSSHLMRWRKAADQAGTQFENWVMMALDHAAEAALEEA